MVVGDVIVTGGPMPPYPTDNFLEQEQFYPDGEEPESDTEAAADEEEDLWSHFCQHLAKIDDDDAIFQIEKTI